MTKITFDDFKKVEMKVGEIVSAEKVPDTDKLLKLNVDFGLVKIEEMDTEGNKSITEKHDKRQVISGISSYFPEPKELIGKKCLFATNLEPRKIKGFDSEAMIVAVAGEQGEFSLLYPNQSANPGMIAR